MKRKKFLFLVSVMFYSILLFSMSSVKVSAASEIDVTNWKYFGTSLQDYELKDYFASQMNGMTNIDLRKDIIYLGYRGNNIQEDVTFKGSKIPINTKQTFTRITNQLLIKKMGIVDGKYIDVRISANQVPLDFTISDSNTGSLIEFSTDRNFNLDASDFHIFMRFYYSGTNTEVASDKHFFLPSTTVIGWQKYISAMLVDRQTKVLVGNKERDNLARTATRTFTDSTKYRIGIGNAPEPYSAYYYNYLFKNNLFEYGFQGTSGFATLGFGFFDPITAVNSMPKPYNNVYFYNEDKLNGNVGNEIYITLPKQDDDSFFPENIVIDYSKYNKSDTTLTVPELTVDDTIIPRTSYVINDSGNIILDKNFLKEYAGERVVITNETNIDYSSERILNDYYNKESFKFDIPYNVKITSNYNDFSQIEFNEESITSIDYPLEFNTIDLNAEVEFGSKTLDYLPSYFLTASTNFPNDTVEVKIEDLTFDKFQENMLVSVNLKSKKLGNEKNVTVNAKVFKKIPIKYYLDTNEEIIPPENIQFPREQKSFYNKEISFDVPNTFSSYKFNSVKTNGFIFKKKEDKYQITGNINEETKEISIVYEFDVVNVTIEYLVGDESSSYDMFKPVKEGIDLDKNVQSITIEAKIGEPISEFIEENKEVIRTKIDYYKNNFESGLTSNYWHYTNQPVNEKNPSNPIKAQDKIPEIPITITSLYTGTTTIVSVSDINFGTHKNDLNLKEIVSKNPINYSFIDTTVSKKNSLNLRVETDPINELNQKMSAFSFEYKGQTINKEDTKIIQSNDKNKNIFKGDLKSDLLFKRYWLGPESSGEFNATLIWTIARDITL